MEFPFYHPTTRPTGYEHGFELGAAKDAVHDVRMLSGASGTDVTVQGGEEEHPRGYPKLSVFFLIL